MFFNNTNHLGRIAGAAVVALSVMCPLAAEASTIISNPGRYNGGSLGVQTQTGTNCTSRAPDRASVSAVAGTRSRDYTGGYYGGSSNSEMVGGVIITVPFGPTAGGNCSELLRVEELRQRLDMAVTLFEAGAMSAEELKALADEIKGDL